MPTNKVSFASVLGVRTEGANTSQELRPPNSMYDARNVVSREPGQLTSREGTKWAAMLSQDHTNCLMTGIYAIPDSLRSKFGCDLDMVHLGYSSGSPVKDMYFHSKDVTTAGLYLSTAVDNSTMINQNYAIGSNGGDTQTRTGGVNELQWPVGGRNPTPATEKLGQFYPKYIANNAFRFVGCSNGLYKIAPRLDGAANENKSGMRHAHLPSPEIVGVVEQDSGTASIFTERGRSADFVAVIAYEQPDGTYVYSRPSTPFTYTSANRRQGTVHVGVAYDLTNIAVDPDWGDIQSLTPEFTNYYLQVYRTKTYKLYPDIGPDGVETAPVEPRDPSMYLAFEEQLSSTKTKNYYANTGSGVTGWVASGLTMTPVSANNRTISANTAALGGYFARYTPTATTTPKFVSIDVRIPYSYGTFEALAVSGPRTQTTQRIQTYLNGATFLQVEIQNASVIGAVAYLSNIQIVDAYPVLVNDDGLILQTQLYTNINNEGVGSTSFCAPIAGCITPYKNTAVYSNVIKPPVGVVVPVSYNKTDTDDRLVVSNTSVNFPLQTENSSILGYSAPDNSDILYYTGSISTAVLDGSSDIYPFAATALPAVSFAKAADPSPDFTITYTLGTDVVNPGLFSDAGGSIAITSTSTSNCWDIIAYKSLVRAVTGAVVTLTFKDCKFLRRWTGGTALSGTYNVRYLSPSTNLELIPGYLSYSGSDTIITLVPLYVNKSIKFPLGYFSAVSGASGLGGTFTYKGPLVRTDYDWLKEQYFKMVRDYNMYRDSINDPVAYISSDFDFSVSFVSNFYGAFKAGSLNPAVNGTYGTRGLVINAQTPSAAQKYFSQDLTNSTEITEETSHIINGIIPSHNGRFETTPQEYARKPFRVGREDCAIIATATSNGEFYIFKEKEGIYRLSMQESIGYPDIVNSVLLDNTYHCIAPNSIQVLDSNVVFLSNRGVVAITPSQQIIELTKNIESDLMECVDTYCNSNARLNPGSSLKETEMTLKADICSAVSPSRRLYLLHIPQANQNTFKNTVDPYTHGATYAFDAHNSEWTKWDFPVTAGCEVDSKLLLSTYIKDKFDDIFNNTTSALYKVNRVVGILSDTSDGYAQNVPDTIDTLNDGKYVLQFISITKANYVTTIVLDGTQPISPFAPELDIKNALIMATTGPEIYSSTPAGVSYTHQAKGRRPFVRDQAGKVFPFDEWAYSNVTKQLTLISRSKYVYDTIGDVRTPATTNVNVWFGINTDVTTNRYYAAGGVGKARFVEGQVLIQDDVTYARQSFSNNAANDFSIWSQHLNNRDVVRTWVPTDASIGRYVLSRVQHNTPGERFDIIGLNYVYRDLGTFRTTKGNEV